MPGFRVDGRLGEEARRCAEALGIERSELLRQALRRHLTIPRDRFRRQAGRDPVAGAHGAGLPGAAGGDGVLSVGRGA